MDATDVNRRQFLQTGAIATALVTAGGLPLLSAQTEAGMSIDASTGPHAVKPIRDQLKRFSPAEGSLRENEIYSLTYDIASEETVADNNLYAQCYTYLKTTDDFTDASDV